MTDRFSITPLPDLLKIMFNQLEKGSLFGIPSLLFFKPENDDSFRTYRFGKLLETPIGVAAGPQTQLSQNIVTAWLMGARYIELKTIQTLDELDIAKPCIDMQDEGYNCEWSQELKIQESFEQYLDAWILIHILKHKFNWKSEQPGVIFNMSVGYDYAGIQNNNVQWFLDKMQDASEEINHKKQHIEAFYPAITEISVDPCVSNNVTLSTMHGCPVDEIEKIGKYLIEERKLHTTIKLNPTLLGEQDLNNKLDNSGFDTKIPESAFDHDPKFDEIVTIIQNLEKSSQKNNVQFGLKLTNTLESKNHKNVFPASETMMYMSGRALHPIAVHIACKLQKEFNGKLDISFSGGVDAFNVFRVLECGLSPVTVCTDLLKPGGYGRLNQYVEQLRDNCRIPDSATAFEHLKQYAQEVIDEDRYKKTEILDPDIKTERILSEFDCIEAPCVQACPTNQGIPDYMYFTSRGMFEKAHEVILRTNPFPRVTGSICDHPCQLKCTRINYEYPVQIREVKRFIAETNDNSTTAIQNNAEQKAAIIGAGPSGLSCAYFLARSGFTVTVYEKKQRPGGMVSGAIPRFRLTDDAFSSDLERIEKYGVNTIYEASIDPPFFENLRSENNWIYISTGAQQSAKLDIENITATGVLDPLQFLFDVKNDKPTGLGKNVIIIGGGNTAMDAARTAHRLVGKTGKVTIVYRRTKKQMPADIGEIKAVMQEGVEIIKLASPVKINVSKSPDGNRINESVRSLSCIKMELFGTDQQGRPKPVPIPGSEFSIDCDTIIPAIGQVPDIDFVDQNKLLTRSGSYETLLDNVFIGGDALRGASTAINAIGDGRKAAEEIIRKAGLTKASAEKPERKPLPWHEHILNRSKRSEQIPARETTSADNRSFELISLAFSEKEAIQEASRCLHCDEFCSICTTVCPNLALQTFEVEPFQCNTERIFVEDSAFKHEVGDAFEIKQSYQILHIADWCNQCGNCTTFCPTEGAPYREKPHLYLSFEAFEKEKDGYYFKTNSNYDIIYYRKENHYSTLAKLADHYLYKSDNTVLKIDQDSFEVLDVTGDKKNNFDINTKEALVMSIVMKGAKSFLSI